MTSSCLVFTSGGNEIVHITSHTFIIYSKFIKSPSSRYAIIEEKPANNVDETFPLIYFFLKDKTLLIVRNRLYSNLSGKTFSQWNNSLMCSDKIQAVKSMFVEQTRVTCWCWVYSDQSSMNLYIFKISQKCHISL